MKKTLTAALAALLLLSSCGNGTKTLPEKPERQEAENVEDIMIEAEWGNLLGGASLAANGSGYSGDGYVTNFHQAGDGVELLVSIPVSCHYDLHFYLDSNSAKKENKVWIDGVNIGNVATESEDFSDCVVNNVWLDEGEHTIRLTSGWGWVDFDKLVISQGEELKDSFYDVAETLVNPNATKETVNLYNYLKSIYGRCTLSGQHADGFDTEEFKAIEKKTGKLPAIIEIDLMNLSISRGGDAGKVDEFVKLVQEYDKKGGIVVINWHWNAPRKYLYDTAEHPWWSGFYTDATNIDIEKIMNGEDSEGLELLYQDMDLAAEVLKKLQDKKIPVLFRPLHEASGGWFWWGARGAEPYKKLYKALYERMVSHHGLNNLIWVWNSEGDDWYPGDEVVDIASTDIYAAEHEHSSQIDKFIRMGETSNGKKMVALAENGVQIDPDMMIRDNVYWLYFCTWSGDFITSDKYTSDEMLKKVYNSEYIITLDELPKWKKGKF